MCVQRQTVFIIIHLGLLVISQGSRNTFVGNMEKRNGNVKSVQSSMLFNLIGKLTLRSVVQESIDVTVALFSRGKLFKIFLFFFLSIFLVYFLFLCEDLFFVPCYCFLDIFTHVSVTNLDYCLYI